MSKVIYDISNWNRAVDLARVKQGGAFGIIPKATEAETFVDPFFVDRAREAHRLGLHVGAYHFARPGAGEPGRQVTHFLDVVRSAGVPMTIRPAPDMEISDGLGAAATSLWFREFCAGLRHALGYRPLDYSYLSFVQEGRVGAGLAGDPLWLALYGRSSIEVPKPWRRAALWQVGQRQVAGISAGDGPGVDTNLVLDWRHVRVPNRRTPAHRKTPRPTPPRWYHRELAPAKPMMRGRDVRQLQAALGMPRRERDGVFGPHTAAEVRGFQHAHHLVVDGVVGPKTAAWL